MKIALVAGARPNFMKVAPIIRALEPHPDIKRLFVHTGQHYDAGLSDVFLKELHLPAPDVWLGVGSGSHAEQTAKVMTGFEAVCLKERPDLVLVVGDVNSTMACAIVAAKFNIKLAHVEAGLRSRDRTMPEEVNRLVTDVLADVLFTTSADANENLEREGIPSSAIHLVGNVMVDSLMEHLPAAQSRDVLGPLGLLSDHGIPRDYAVLTLHRPANVDHAEVFEELMRGIEYVSSRMPVIFPVHPRTAERVRARAWTGDLRVTAPLGYLDFLSLTSRARLILTDSGGLQEEATVLRVPCLTLRDNTERPVTVTMGSNVLVGRSEARIRAEVDRVLSSEPRAGSLPPLWDGAAARRIVEVLTRLS